MWPQHAAYLRALRKPSEALVHPRFLDAIVEVGMGGDGAGRQTIKHGRGAFAVVPRIIVKGKPEALKLFTFEPTARECITRYKSLQRTLCMSSRPRSLITVEVVDDAVRVDGAVYPGVLMPWVDARALRQVVEQSLGDRAALEGIAAGILTLTAELAAFGIAHGDLHAENIRVRADGSFVLVDYDAMWHASTAAARRLELGHAEYHHPRATLDDYGPAMDNFVLWHMYLSVIALARDPSLWEFGARTDMGLLFCSSDFRDPASSPLLTRLMASRDHAVRSLALLLVRFLELRPLQVPRLSGARGGRAPACPLCGRMLDEEPGPRASRCFCRSLGGAPKPVAPSSVLRAIAGVLTLAAVGVVGVGILKINFTDQRPGVPVPSSPERPDPAPDSPTASMAVSTAEGAPHADEPPIDVVAVQPVSAAIAQTPVPTAPAAEPDLPTELSSVDATVSGGAVPTPADVPDPTPVPPARTSVDLALACLAACRAQSRDTQTWKSAVTALTALGIDGGHARDLTPEESAVAAAFIDLAAQSQLGPDDARWSIISSGVTALAASGNGDAIVLLASVCIVVKPPTLDGAMPGIRLVADAATCKTLQSALASARGPRGIFYRGCLVLAMEADPSKAAAAASEAFVEARDLGDAPAASMLAAFAILRAGSRKPMTPVERESLVSDALEAAKDAAERGDPAGMYLYGLTLSMWRKPAHSEVQAWMVKAAGSGYATAIEWCKRERIVPW